MIYYIYILYTEDIALNNNNTVKGIVFFDYDGTVCDEKENIFMPMMPQRCCCVKVKEVQPPHSLKI